jgi:hypothetical protein
MPVNHQCPALEVHLLGEIVVAFGNLELFLEAMIWLLIGEDNPTRHLMAQAITAEMSFERKVNAFASMFKVKRPSHAKAELEALVKELFAVQGERNALLHSAWTYSQNFEAWTRTKASAKARQGLRRRVHRMTPERLKVVRKHIAVVGDSLARFTMAHIQ